MGVYNASKPPVALYPGNTFVISNASLGSATLTQQVALHQEQGNPANVTIHNRSAATLTVKVSPDDSSAASYLPLTGVSVPAASALSFSTTMAFMAVLPSVDPGSSVITVCR